MNITKNKLFYGILAFLILIDILVAFDLKLFYARATLSFLFITIVPGLLIMLIMKIREIGFWEYLVYVVGLSISFIMFAGLAVNWILPWLNITDKPLATWPILISFNILLITFWTIAKTRNKDLNPINIKLPKLDTLNTIMFTIPVLFPILAILGAFFLNNHGTNIITMIMLGGIAVYVLMIVVFRERLNPNIYPWALYLMGIGIMFSSLLRGQYIFNSDTGFEYQIFQLTKEKLYWSMDNLYHTYNAMLITNIFPTLLNTFIKINDYLIFKLIFPLFFSLIPVIIYFLNRRFSDKKVICFLGSFLFMSFIPFFTPIHNRQFFAVFFFALVIAIFFLKGFSILNKKLLFLILGATMIVAHYSTSYISLLIFLLTYLLINLFKLFGRNKGGKEFFFPRGTLIIVLLLLGFFWYSQVTPTSEGLIDFTHKSLSNVENLFSKDMGAEQNSIFDQFNIFYKYNSNILLYKNIENISLKYSNKESSYYPPETYTNYSLSVVQLPEHISKLSRKSLLIISFFVEIVKKIIKFFVIVGSLGIIYLGVCKKKIDLRYVSLVIISLLIILLVIIVPLASIEYDSLRTFHQMLIILSLPAVLGGIFLFRFFKYKYRLILVSLILILYFLVCSGFAQQAIGGLGTPSQLNNFGGGYYGLYIQNYEEKSISWISNTYKSGRIYTDWGGMTRFAVFDKDLKFNYLTTRVILPSLIGKDSYVYSSYINKLHNAGFIWVEHRSITFNFPTEFLHENKNKIYNNGGSEIFK